MDEYKIKIYGDFLIADIGCVCFHVSLRTNHLIMLRNSSLKTVNITIPSMLPSGHSIKVLDPSFLRGKFNEVRISNGISISANAFACTVVNKVIWPDDCYTIPRKCFNRSFLNSIENISNVNRIDYCAFEMTCLDELDLSSTDNLYFEEKALYGIPNSCKIKLPYYMNEDSYNKAFGLKLDKIEGGENWYGL